MLRKLVVWPGKFMLWLMLMPIVASLMAVFSLIGCVELFWDAWREIFCDKPNANEWDKIKLE